MYTEEDIFFHEKDNYRLIVKPNPAWPSKKMVSLEIENGYGNSQFATDGTRNQITMRSGANWYLPENFIKNLKTAFNEEHFFHEYRHFVVLRDKKRPIHYVKSGTDMKGYINQHMELDAQFAQTMKFMKLNLDADIDLVKKEHARVQKPITQKDLKSIIENDIFVLGDFKSFADRLFSTWEENRKKISAEYYGLKNAVKKRYLKRMYLLYSHYLEYAKKQLLDQNTLPSSAK